MTASVRARPGKAELAEGVEHDLDAGLVDPALGRGGVGMRRAPGADRRLGGMRQAGGQFLEQRQPGDRVGFQTGLVDHAEGVLGLPPGEEGLEEGLLLLKWW